MKMAELERRTGVGRETIRYYIREGLLPEPERRARNVAVYSDVHVERLKSIKRLQEERFLPLEVIRRVLEIKPRRASPAPSGHRGRKRLSPGAWTMANTSSSIRCSRPRPPASDPFAQLGPLLAARLGVGEGESLVALDTLVAGDRQTARDIEAFAEAGAIDIRHEDGRPVVSRLDARIVALWRDIRRAGYGPDDFPADFITLYTEALAPMAEVEVARFFAGFEGRTGQADATEKAQAGVEMVNALMAALRTRFILDAVARRAARRL